MRISSAFLVLLPMGFLCGAIHGPITKIVPQENDFTVDFGTVRPGDTLILHVTSPCGIRNGTAAGGGWAGGPTVFTVTIPTNAAAAHQGVFLGEYIPCPGGQGSGPTAWSGRAKANVLQFKRNDSAVEDPSILQLHSFMYAFGAIRPFSRQQVFNLNYAPGETDRLDGSWDHTYVLESRGSDIVTSQSEPNWLGPAGALYAVGYALQVGGQVVFSGGAAADSRSSPAGNASVQVGGVTINLPVSAGAHASASIDFTSDVNVPVMKSSAEGAALNHQVTAVVSGNAQVVFAGPSLIGNNGSGTLKWRDSKVLEGHFHP